MHVVSHTRGHGPPTDAEEAEAINRVMLLAERIIEALQALHDLHL